MIRVLKPTRLWHLTGRKHAVSILRDRENVRPRSMNTRRSKDTLQLYAVVLSCVAAIAYSYGRMSPRRDLSKIKHPEKNPCEKDEKVCTGKEKPGPCPPTKDSPKPRKCDEC